MVTAAISFLHNGSMGQFGKIGSRRLFANVSDIIAFVLGLKTKLKISVIVIHWKFTICY